MTELSRRPILMTTKYSVQQSAYWMAVCGLISFAATFLMAKGFTASQVGVILALTSLLSCLLQPLMAAFADRTEKVPLIVIIAVVAALSGLCTVLILAVPMPRTLFAAVYLTGALLMDAMLPLLNAVSVYYSDRGAPINFGIGRGVGSLLFGVSSLAVGKGMEALGADMMPAFVIAVTVVYIAVTLTYPVVRRRSAEPQAEELPPEESEEQSCTLPEFFRRYKWFCLSLAGILFMASFHAMTENFMINIMRRLGGTSGNVGIALTIATVSEVPIFFAFSRIRQKLTTPLVLKIASLTFLLKAVLFLIAPGIPVIYAAMLLQTTSYGFCSPAQVFYANERIAKKDMVKGQAMATASYALGCSLGNLLGGWLIDGFGVVTLLWTGVALAVLGVAVIFLTVDKKDAASM